MFKLLGKADTWLDVGLRWGTAFAAAWASLSWLAKQMSQFGDLNWADSAALGLGGALLLSVVVSFALISIRFFRPLPMGQAGAPNPTLGSESKYSDLFDQVQLIAAALARGAENQTKVDTALNERLDSLQGIAESRQTSLEKIISELRDGLSGRLDEHRTWLAGLDKSLDAVRGALPAIFHRERMLAIAATIEDEATALSQALTGGRQLGEEEWEKWKSDERIWEAKIGNWSTFAQFYSHDPVAAIKRINAEDFEGEWSIAANQFPDLEGIRNYKTFRIYLRNWKSVSEVVHQRVRRAAFEGQKTLIQED